MFKYKMKASDGHKEYIKNPDLLQNCSTGFYFPSQSEEEAMQVPKISLSLFMNLVYIKSDSHIGFVYYQGNVSSLKLLRFYQAVE